MLVLDVSNNLFQNVFHRNNACRLSVLIHHDHQMTFGCLHHGKQGIDVARLGDEVHLADQTLDLRDRRVINRRIQAQFQSLLDM